MRVRGLGERRCQHEGVVVVTLVNQRTRSHSTSWCTDHCDRSITGERDRRTRFVSDPRVRCDHGLFHCVFTGLTAIDSEGTDLGCTYGLSVCTYEDVVTSLVHGDGLSVPDQTIDTVQFIDDVP